MSFSDSALKNDPISMKKNFDNLPKKYYYYIDLSIYRYNNNNLFLKVVQVFSIDIGSFFNAESENDIRFPRSGQVSVLGRF